MRPLATNAANEDASGRVNAIFAVIWRHGPEGMDVPGFDPDVTIAMAYAPAAFRDGFAALLALDAQLGEIVQSAKEPMLARIRLAWWREQLEGLRTAPFPADPVLQQIHVLLQRHDVKEGELARLVNGWETLLEDEVLSESGARFFASERGGALFEIAGQIAGLNNSGCQTGLGRKPKSCRRRFGPSRFWRVLVSVISLMAPRAAPAPARPAG
jgi:hypothetical protein